MARAIATRPVDVAPAGVVSYPSTGLERGWETVTLVAAALLILSFGLVSLYSATLVIAQRNELASYHYVAKQITGAGLGLVAMIVASRIPYRWWRHLAWPLIGFSWILLVIIVLPWTEAIAPPVNGARRWIRIGVAFQPSDLAKLAVVVWTASLAVKKREHFRSLTRGLLPFILVWMAVVIPIVLEPDLSTALLIAMLGALVVFTAGARLAHFIFLGILALPLLLAQLNVGFRLQRFIAFFNPEADTADAGFQLHQSLVALGSGGLTGVGFGEGRQKFGFLPEVHNDFIFAVIGEEWGFLGVTAILGLYLLMIVVGFKIGRKAPDLFGRLLAIGLTNLIALHAVLHMSIGLGILPTTGLALPLISYGRSNLLVTMAAIGILVAIGRESRQRRAAGA